MTVSEQTALHHDELARRDQLTSKYSSDVMALEDKLNQSQLQVILCRSSGLLGTAFWIQKFRI